MSAKTQKLKIAAVGDIHWHETARDAYKDISNSDLFGEICAKADVLLLCGDLTKIGLVEQAEHLAQDLKVCDIPVLAVLGNHDYHNNKQEEIKNTLRKSGVVFLDEGEVFQIGNVGFAGAKGFGGGFDNYMLSSFGEPATKHFVKEAVDEAMKLEHSLSLLETDKKVVALHYSPIRATIETEPVEIHAYLGCSRFAEVIDRFDVSAVFHGHAHHGVHEGKTAKGIPVYNCAVHVTRKHKKIPYTIIEV